jgi:hypothetical protein
LAILIQFVAVERYPEPIGRRRESPRYLVAEKSRVVRLQHVGLGMRKKYKLS